MKKRLMSLLLAMALMIGMMPAMTLSASAEDPDPKSWMAYLPDSIPISEINMPGTHDSGTTHVGKVTVSGSCHDKTISEQLDMGVRVLDLRLFAGVGDSDYEKAMNMYINHGGFKCSVGAGPFSDYLRFKHVFQYAKDFLTDHPTETIVFYMSGETFTDWAKKDAIAAVRKVIHDYHYTAKEAPYPEGEELFKFLRGYEQDDPVPMLGEVRGKIVLIQDNGSCQDIPGARTVTSYEMAYDYKTDLDNDINNKRDRIFHAFQDANANGWKIRENPRDLDKWPVFHREGNYENLKNPGNPDVKQVGTNVTDIRGDDASPVFGGLAYYTPSQCANMLYEVLKKDNSVLNQIQTGYRYGWVTMDFPERYPELHKALIRSNYAKTVYKTTVTVTDIPEVEEKDIRIDIGPSYVKPEVTYTYKEGTDKIIGAVLRFPSQWEVEPENPDFEYVVAVSADKDGEKYIGVLKELNPDPANMHNYPFGASTCDVNETLSLQNALDTVDITMTVQYDDPLDQNQNINRPSTLKDFIGCFGPMTWLGENFAPDGQEVIFTKSYYPEIASEASYLPDTLISYKQVEGSEDKYTLTARFLAAEAGGCEKYSFFGFEKISEYCPYDYEIKDDTIHVRLKALEAVVPYLAYDPQAGAFEQKHCEKYTYLNNLDDSVLESGWYVVRSLCTRENGFTVLGHANLILTDGCLLDMMDKCPITIMPGNSLTIYSQSHGRLMGKMRVSGALEWVGIGAYGSGFGELTIHGGSIEVKKGGTDTPAIGGGGGKLTMYGGDILSAEGNGSAPGIGGAAEGKGCMIILYGGSITAQAGELNDRAIGAGKNGKDNGSIIVARGSTLRNNLTGEVIQRSFAQEPWIDVFSGNKVSFTVVPQEIEPVEFLMYDEAAKEYKSETINTYETLNASMNMLPSGWYVMKGSGTMDEITVQGDVHLILTDNSSLTVPKGFHVGEGSQLTIYSQSLENEGENEPGKLTAGPNRDKMDAGIGGEEGENGGTIIIQGGNIDAYAGLNAAGIGGGRDGNGGNITIYGGKVNGTGGPAGIGSYMGSIVTIVGGEVTATASGKNGIYADGVVVSPRPGYDIQVKTENDEELDGSPFPEETDITTKVSEHRVVHTKEVEHTYTVTFEMNGHGKQIKRMRVADENRVILPEKPAEDGWIFEGWYRDAELTTLFWSDTQIDEDITLYAKWSAGVSKIEVTTQPAKTAYGEGEDFDVTGMVVTATYGDGTTKDVTEQIEVVNGSELKQGRTSVTIRYSEYDVTKETEVPIKVGPPIVTLSFDMNGHGEQIEPQKYSQGDRIVKPEDPTEEGWIFEGWYFEAECKNEIVVSGPIFSDHTLYAKWTPAVTEIKVTTQPDKIAYTEGETFDASGMVVTATYGDGKTKAVTDYTVSPDRPLTKDDTKVTITYTENGVTKTVDVNIAVNPAIYTVSFDMGGHGTQVSQTVESGSMATEPKAPSASGWIFGGWYTDAEFTTEFDFGAAITGNTTVYAKWTAAVIGIEVSTQPTKTVYTAGETFETDGMVVSAAYGDGTIGTVTDYTVTPDRPLKKDDTKVTITYTENGVTKTAEVNIKVNPVIYTVSFDMGGHGAEVAAQTVEKGEKATRPTAPSESGWIFGGWYADAEFATEFNFGAAINENTTVYAKWTEVVVTGIKVKTQPTKTTYTEGETFDGTGMVVTVTYSDGSTEDVTDYTVTPDGPLTKEDNKVTITYTENGVPKTVVVNIKVNPVTYTVSFDMGGHGAEVAAQTVEKGEKATEPAAPSEKGWIFDGWYADAEFATEFDFGAAINENTTVYAKWTEVVVTGIKVNTQPTKTVYTEGETFETNGMVVTATYSDGSEKDVTDYTVTPDRPLTKDDTKVTITYTENGVPKTVVVNIKVNPVTYTVRFDMGGHGAQVDAQTIESGSTATEPEAPSEEGWIFGGWYTDEECTTKFDFDTAITENTTVYAKWTEAPVPKTYTVTVRVNNEEMGTASASPRTAEAGTTIELTADAYDGYHFVEWVCDGVVISSDSFTMPEKNVTVTAVFEIDEDLPEPIEFTVTVTVNDSSMGTASASARKAEAGTKIYLTAVPFKGYRFVGWESDEVIASSGAFEMPDEDVTVVAVFEENPVPETYSITVEVNDGSLGTAYASAETAEPGTMVSLTANAKENGYFIDWDSPDVEIFDNCFEMPDCDVTVYAMFAERTPEDEIFTITVKTNDKAMGTASASLYTAEEGELIELTATAKDGHRFVKWKTEDVEISSNFFDMPAKDVTITAIFEKIPVEYAITEGDGSEWTKGSIEGLTFVSNAPFDKFDSVKVDGTSIEQSMYMAEEGSTRITLTPGFLQELSTGSHTIKIKSKDGSASASFTVKAAPTNTVSFDMGGHGTQVDSQKVEVGKKAVQPSKPTASGWRFVGWYADAECTTRFDFDAEITGNTTVYAKWTPDVTEIKVTNSPKKTVYKAGERFDPTGMIVTATYSDGSKKSVTDYTVTPSGTLTDEDTYVTISYTEGGETKTVRLAITVKAVYTVSFDMGGHGTQISPQTVEEGQKATQPTKPTASGYSFSGWYVDSSYSKVFSFNTAIEEDTTVYAKWVKKSSSSSSSPSTYTPSSSSSSSGTTATYTVSFRMGGHGEQVPSQSVRNGGKVTKPANPTETGWRFEGWYADATFSKTFDFGTAIHSSTIIYAKWTKLVPAPTEAPEYYTVFFKMEGHGNQVPAMSVMEGSSAEQPEDPTASGWIFDGWYVDEDYTEEFDFNTEIDEDITVYAKWEEIPVEETEEAPELPEEETEPVCWLWWLLLIVGAAVLSGIIFILYRRKKKEQ